MPKSKTKHNTTTKKSRKRKEQRGRGSNIESSAGYWIWTRHRNSITTNLRLHKGEKRRTADWKKVPSPFHSQLPLSGGASALPHPASPCLTLPHPPSPLLTLRTRIPVALISGVACVRVPPGQSQSGEMEGPGVRLLPWAEGEGRRSDYREVLLPDSLPPLPSSSPSSPLPVSFRASTHGRAAARSRPLMFPWCQHREGET